MRWRQRRPSNNSWIPSSRSERFQATSCLKPSRLQNPQAHAAVSSQPKTSACPVEFETRRSQQEPATAGHWSSRPVQTEESSPFAWRSREEEGREASRDAAGLGRRSQRRLRHGHGQHLCRASVAVRASLAVLLVQSDHGRWRRRNFGGGRW